MMRVAHTAIAGCTCMYLAAALWGYITFGDRTKNNLLDNYKDQMADRLTSIVNMMLCISFIFTVPLIQFPHRRALEQLLFKEMPFAWGRQLLIGFVTTGIVLTLAIEVPQITEVFGAVGSTSSVTLVFLLPAGIFLKLEEGAWHSKSKLPAAILLVVGGAIGLVSLGAFVATHAN